MSKTLKIILGSCLVLLILGIAGIWYVTSNVIDGWDEMDSEVAIELEKMDTEIKELSRDIMDPSVAMPGKEAAMANLEMIESAKKSIDSLYDQMASDDDTDRLPANWAMFMAKNDQLETIFKENNIEYKLDLNNMEDQDVNAISSMPLWLLKPIYKGASVLARESQRDYLRKLQSGTGGEY